MYGKDNKVCRIKVTRFDDRRGTLCYVTGGVEFPFEIKRMFWISDVPVDATRGEHAHWTCAEAVFAVTGGFDIYIDDGKESGVYSLQGPDEGVIIPPKVWCRLQNFQPGTVCVVAASEPYNSDGYVNDYESYIKRLKCK